ncbi:MAG TPA: hypothetical protein VJT50_09630 [Pyrinomonadaceae bacterium]|nr:hypothetical protein [Pyrinomonadaceae bacterium]
MITNQTDSSARTECESCGERVPMVTPDEAAQIRQVSTRAIFRGLENGELHFTETEKGYPLICLNSLNHENSLLDLQADIAAISPGSFQQRVMKRIFKRPQRQKGKS